MEDLVDPVPRCHSIKRSSCGNVPVGCTIRECLTIVQIFDDRGGNRGGESARAFMQSGGCSDARAIKNEAIRIIVGHSPVHRKLLGFLAGSQARGNR